MNIFENTFKISQGKMDLDTVYHNDYPKLNMKDRGPIMTQEMVENKNKRVVSKIPMDARTQTMVDYSYDPETFRLVSKNNKEPYANNLFQSKLNKGLKPQDNSQTNIIVPDSSFDMNFRNSLSRSLDENHRSKSTIILPNFGESHLTHNKNIVNFFFQRRINIQQKIFFHEK